MKKLAVVLAAAMAVIALVTVGIAQTSGGDAERAEGIARGALSDCISDARAAGNEILTSSFPGEGEGDWLVVFCGRQRDINYQAQRVGNVVLDGWEVVSAVCEFPAPTNNPCF